jgi:hypothetical protein
VSARLKQGAGVLAEREHQVAVSARLEQGAGVLAEREYQVVM